MKRKLRAFLIIVGFIFLPTTMVFQNCAPHQSASSINTESSENTSDTENPPNMPTPAPPTPPVPTGPVLNVPSQYATIQAAIDAAQLGDTIVVEAGRIYSENLVLKYKASGTGWITIQSSKLHLLPASGNRVSPADAVNMPTIRSTMAAGTSPIVTQSGATPSHHYKLVGLNVVRHNSTAQQTALIRLGTADSSQDTLAEEPHHFVIDRCLIRGADGADTRRGIAINARDIEVRDSYIDKFHENGVDTQAILGWNGSGNHLIINNFLEATGENIMYGGATPTIPNLVPSNILIDHNHFFKPLSWKGNEPGPVKNLFETKSVRQLIMQNNIFENNWNHAQDGKAIHFSLRGDGNIAPWSTVEDITLRYNIIKNSGAGISFLLTDYDGVSQVMHRMSIHNNLILIGNNGGTGSGYAIMLIEGRDSVISEDIHINHNTFIHHRADTGNRMLEFDGGSSYLKNFIFRDNIVTKTASAGGEVGRIARSGVGGLPALEGAVNGPYIFSKNVIQRAISGMPADSHYISDIADVNFTNANSGNFVLASSSPYKNAGTDGKDIGADMTELNRRTACVVSGQRSLCP